MANRLVYLLSICLMLALNTARSEEKSLPTDHLPPEIKKALNESALSFADRLMPAVMTLDENGDGAVSLRSFISHLMSRGFAKVGTLPPGVDDKGSEPRWIKRRYEGYASTDKYIAKNIKTDEKGNVTREGLAHTYEQSILYSLHRLVILDADHDEKLSLAEYALGFPVTETSEMDEEGYSKYQRTFFNRMDADNSGYIEGGEFLGSTARTETGVVATAVAIVIHRADIDQNGKLDRDEITKLLPDMENEPDTIQISKAMHWLRSLSPDQLTKLEEKLIK